MKQIITIFSTVFMLQTAIAQTGKPVVTAYGAATAEWTTINNKSALGIGAYGGVLLKHQWFFGLGGSNLLFKQQVNGKATAFQFNQYGVYTEQHFFPAAAVRLTTGITAGMGWLTYDAANAGRTNTKDGVITYVIQPKIGVTIPVLSFMKVQLNGGYRFTGDVKSSNYNAQNLDGFSGGAALLFGKF